MAAVGRMLIRHSTSDARQQLGPQRYSWLSKSPDQVSVRFLPAAFALFLARFARAASWAASSLRVTCAIPRLAVTTIPAASPSNVSVSTVALNASASSPAIPSDELGR